MIRKSPTNDIPSSSTTHRRRFVLAALPVALVAAAIIAGGKEPDEKKKEKLIFETARMYIEFNDTDQDVGIQMFLDGEPWKRLRVEDTTGKRLLVVRAANGVGEQGLSEFFYESAEPSLDEVSLEEFLDRFPEGIYEFEGVTLDGKEIEGEALFTHAIPLGPVLVSPIEDSIQDREDTVVTWLPVPDPSGSFIDAYQVVVTQEIEVFPKRTFSVHVPASVNSVTVPAEFLQPDADYEFEVLAIEAGGNQTISASFFSTAR